MSAGKKLPVRSSKRPGRAGSESHQLPVQPRSRAEHYAAGKALRETCPRDAHAAWKAPSDRRDAVELVLEA
ncbi:MAG: hypothetical protein MUO25_01375, partial [Thermoanaerobaculaceae bacterium]|nr:hypothetical protein [Thermoanaerobaculaceae bacterium]